MDFKTRKIRKHISHRAKEQNINKEVNNYYEDEEREAVDENYSEYQSSENKPKKKLVLSISIGAFILIAIALLIGIYYSFRSIDMKVFLAAAGDELITDKYGHTNFMILGTGGKNHEGSDLTDTILVASLDQESKTVNMISIPRDLYIEDEIIGNSKINEVYFYAAQHYGSAGGGLRHLKNKIEEMIGEPIHYWLMIDFDGFTQIVDIMGGVDVYVEEAIYDPYYPKDGTFLYEPFSISAGVQHLDGETALKYARSRKTTSDFDRARRQQQIIFALKEKALATEIIFSKEKISEILNALKANIETNIKAKEILTLGSIAEDYTKDRINQKLIHDDPNNCGGFLYTPARDYYGGMFVLIPAGGIEFVHKYIDMNFKHPLISMANEKIHILNGTSTGGVAGEAKQILQRFCFDVNRFGNASTKTVTKTTYYYEQKYDENGEKIDSRPVSLDFLQTLIPGIESTNIPTDYQEYMLQTDILLEIGSDYVNSEEYIDDPFYYLQTIYTAPAASEESENAEIAETAAITESTE
ncbi:hypothetical protein GF354_05725 [Candidatus Peregrinibacteria bacterium]|nr:hypothetical protein [Candidatus Peregrinibacteria bacterium]